MCSNHHSPSQASWDTPVLPRASEQSFLPKDRTGTKKKSRLSRHRWNASNPYEMHWFSQDPKTSQWYRKPVKSSAQQGEASIDLDRDEDDDMHKNIMHGNEQIPSLADNGVPQGGRSMEEDGNEAWSNSSEALTDFYDGEDGGNHERPSPTRHHVQRIPLQEIHSHDRDVDSDQEMLSDGEEQASESERKRPVLYPGSDYPIPSIDHHENPERNHAAFLNEYFTADEGKENQSPTIRSQNTIDDGQHPSPAATLGSQIVRPERNRNSENPRPAQWPDDDPRVLPSPAWSPITPRELPKAGEETAQNPAHARKGFLAGGTPPDRRSRGRFSHIRPERAKRPSALWGPRYR
ncbi:hypothetical protein BJ875DRAFT_482636 [Amylocarpus encephaloides]|uniref:Uncharacterized protein n=1 Tax=Amylocarpus encephaloides TaxID=45428 RepID=A0A9P7YN19_9HELO|nr:hypothetical protein BJ875DRAFT_482636 [Amylocarpus encephaloides]